MSNFSFLPLFLLTSYLVNTHSSELSSLSGLPICVILYEPACLVVVSTFDEIRHSGTNYHSDVFKCISFIFVAYRLYTVVPRLVKFIDNLTNWYVRSNRKRLKVVTQKAIFNGKLNLPFFDYHVNKTSSLMVKSHSFIHPFFYSFIYAFIPPVIPSLIPSFTRLFLHSFIRLFFLSFAS